MIDLKTCKDKCFADSMGECVVLCESIVTECNWHCPFYKPRGCKDWVRVERGNSVSIYEPEEYDRRFKETAKAKPAHWRI